MQGIRRVPGAELRLEIADPDPPVRLRNMPRDLHPLGKIGHPDCRLQRVLWRNQPPDLVQIQPPHRLATDVQMTLMGRIEGAAKQPDPAPLQQQAAE